MPSARREQTISTRWTRDIVALAISEGADEASLWAGAGLDPNTLADEVREAEHLRAWETIMRALRSPGFPIRVADRRDVDAYALLGLACKTSDTVRDALGHLIRYTSVWRSQYRCELRETEEIATLVLDGPTGELGRRCTNESALAQILKAIRDVSSESVRPVRVSFRHDAPEDLDEHELFFGCELAFGAAFDGLALAQTTLDTRLSLADDALSRFLIEKLEELATKRAPSEALSDDVRHAISGLLPAGAPKLAAVASKLSMSPRTLQRHLASSGTSFAQLVDETRHHLATELLEQTDRPFAEISFVLGFSEPSAFHRAFKRWTGMTPARFRRG